VFALASPAAAQQATEWGWPQPYEKVSEKSVAWLKERWWPMTVAFQPPWSGQNTVNIVMDRMGLMAKRGVEADGRVLLRPRHQRGDGVGPRPGRQRWQLSAFTSLLDKKIPVKAIAILSPNLPPRYGRAAGLARQG
jgi:sulfonate transport system substrate-binding protein